MDWLNNNLGFAGWIVCGFIAYGLLKGSFINTIKEYPENNGYAAIEELICFTIFLAGYMGLLVTILMTLPVDCKLFWCLRAPKELTKKFWNLPKPR